MSASNDSDAALDALAAALAPRVARLLLERAAVDSDSELVTLLESVGYELDESEAP